MPIRLRGALIEYQSDFLGGAPNVVVFQFNPDTIDRTITVPPSPWVTAKTDSAGKPEVLETFSLKLVFDASDLMSFGDPLAVAFGVGQSLAALENMVQPATLLTGQKGTAADATSKALDAAAKATAEEAVGRERYPRVLFVWGHTRLLPVEIDSMVLKELKYDAQLVPVHAEAMLGLSVPPVTRAKDKLGYGALEYTRAIREAQAATGFFNTMKAVADLIPF